MSKNTIVQNVTILFFIQKGMTFMEFIPDVTTLNLTFISKLIFLIYVYHFPGK